jgi:hypothetical protein
MKTPHIADAQPLYIEIDVENEAEGHEEESKHN